jgi:hypothetical protein
VDNGAMLRQRRRGHTSLIAAAIVMASIMGCEDKKPRQATIAAVESETLEKRPRAKEGEACQSNEECGDMLGCAPDKTCQTYKTIECRARDQACKREGRCKGSDSGCVAGSDEDCQRSELCADSGYCSAKDGKCVATKDADCKAVCASQGRCTIEAGECVPGTNDDCKQSEVCKAQGKCVLRRGLCAKAPPPED